MSLEPVIGKYGLHIFGDAIDVMNQLSDSSIDLICVDLPYGVTKNKWDIVIPLDKMWQQFLRIGKPNAAIVLFGQDKFTAKLMLSQEKIHRYNLVWKKGERVSQFLNSNRRPLPNHEDIVVFYRKQPIYNPQMTIGNPTHSAGSMKSSQLSSNYGLFNDMRNNKTGETLKFPKTVLNFDRPHPPIHPTQKPVELISWIVKTYTNEGCTVLDCCSGSGTLPISCIENNRKFISIENDKQEYTKAHNRITSHIKKLYGTDL